MIAQVHRAWQAPNLTKTARFRRVGLERHVSRWDGTRRPDLGLPKTRTCATNGPATACATNLDRASGAKCDGMGHRRSRRGSMPPEPAGCSMRHWVDSWSIRTRRFLVWHPDQTVPRQHEPLTLIGRHAPPTRDWCGKNHHGCWRWHAPWRLIAVAWATMTRCLMGRRRSKAATADEAHRWHG